MLSHGRAPFLSLARTRIFFPQAIVWFGTFEPVPWDLEDS